MDSGKFQDSDMIGMIPTIKNRHRYRSSVQRYRASTLIELLVVISMIGLLISLMVPSMKRSMDVARATLCQHNLREIGQSLSMYRFENNGWLPIKTEGHVSSTGEPINNSWFTKMYPTYLTDSTILVCPKDPYGFRMVGSRDHIQNPEVTDYPSYGINSFILQAGGGFLGNIDRHLPSRPHDTILMADLGPDAIRFGQQSSSGVGPTRNDGMIKWSDGMDPFSGMASNPWITTRHNHGVNVLTLTGGIRHAETDHMLKSPIRKFYDSCAGGGCTLCNELGMFHYSFAKQHLYWWTGPTPRRSN